MASLPTIAQNGAFRVTFCLLFSINSYIIIFNHKGNKEKFYRNPLTGGFAKTQISDRGRNPSSVTR
jgi:hypothetical protein